MVKTYTHKPKNSPHFTEVMKHSVGDTGQCLSLLEPYAVTDKIKNTYVKQNLQKVALK